MGIKPLRFMKACFTAVLLCLVFIMPVCVPSFAETQSKVLFSLTEMRNMSIRVGYETELPVVSFIGPDGTEYVEGKTSTDRMTVDHTEGAVYYYIRNAAPGDWTIVYDKLSNPNLYVDSAPYNEPIVIEDFTVESTSGDRVYLSFEASYYQDDYYDYIVYAALTDKNGMVTGQKELRRGTARANGPVSETVNLSSLASYDEYHLMLEVYLDSHGVESSDTFVLDESLAYTNSNTPDGIEDFYVEVNLTDQSLLVDWSSWAVRCDEYILAAFDPENPDEPSFLSTYPSDITRSDFLIDSTREFIRIELSYVKNGISSEICRKDIPFDTGVEIDITTQQHTNSSQAVIHYSSPNNIEATVTVNGNSETIMLNGNGYFSVPIEEFSNEIMLSYFPGNNLCFVIKSDLYADRTAPILKLYENSSTITVPGSKYTLAGETEPDCTLMINDTTVPLNPDGTFLYELSLAGGANEFTITSTDPAGNASMQTIFINHSQTLVADSVNGTAPFFERYATLLITLALSLIFIVSVLLLTRMHHKRVGKNRRETLLLLLRNGSVVLTIIAGLILLCLLISRGRALQTINSPEFYHLTLESTQDAYDAIMAYTRINGSFVLACYAAGVGLLLTLLFTLILHQIRKKQPRDNGVTCPHCHRHYDNSVRFCIACGSRIDDKT